MGVNPVGEKGCLPRAGLELHRPIRPARLLKRQDLAVPRGLAGPLESVLQDFVKQQLDSPKGLRL